MGLFFDVLNAVNNPQQQASVEQLESLVRSVQQLSQQTELDSDMTQTLISALGNAIRPTLQEQSSAMGEQQLSKVLSQLATSRLLGSAKGGLGVLQVLIPAQMQRQLAQTVAEKTGLAPEKVKSLLPSVILLMISFLNLGANKPGVPDSINPLLSAFWIAIEREILTWER